MNISQCFTSEKMRHQKVIMFFILDFLCKSLNIMYDL